MDKGDAPPAYQPQHYPPSSAAPYPAQPQHYPPPAGGSYPMQPLQQQQVTQVVVTAPTSFDRRPVTMVCPHCRASITTAVDLKTGLLPWLICGGLVLVGCWYGCCIIPFCIDDLKDAVHRCPSCGQVVGQHKVIS